jgi:hypothetical protein
VFEAALDHIEQRFDCADFVLHAILRLLYQFPDHGALPSTLHARAREATLGFKYWPDEPGIDSMCTWTENHQILFASAALLAGQLYPDAQFGNSGEMGREKCRVARTRILRWLDLRFRTGFSEWLSNVYYDEDLVALASLVDFARDAEVQARATMVLDLILLDIAQHSFRGVFGSTHGRSYEASKKWAAKESTTDVAKLLLGLGRFGGGEGMSAACLALSPSYRIPEVLPAVAGDVDRPEVTVRQRLGIRVREAVRWRLGFDSFEDGMVLLSLEAYTHPRTINLVMNMFDRFGWWKNDFFRPFRANRCLIGALRSARLLPLLAKVLERDLTRNLREEVNAYTYRTPDYMLSSAQDWRPGYGGDQQHLWQATLGPDAVCFTTHPGPRRARSPGHWTGSATLPRVAQVENVAIVIYRIQRWPALYVPNRNLYTHAWLPQDQFDEVLERGGWVFARRGLGFLALRSQHAAEWQTEPGEDQNRELIVPGRSNVWICELGREAVDGPFETFMERLTAAKVEFGRARVVYESPSQGRLEFGWRGPLRHRGEIVRLDGYPRYESPYARARFPSEQVEVQHGDRWLRLRWSEARREASRFLSA